LILLKHPCQESKDTLAALEYMAQYGLPADTTPEIANEITRQAARLAQALVEELNYVYAAADRDRCIQEEVVARYGGIDPMAPRQA